MALGIEIIEQMGLHLLKVISNSLMPTDINPNGLTKPSSSTQDLQVRPKRDMDTLDSLPDEAKEYIERLEHLIAKRGMSKQEGKKLIKEFTEILRSLLSLSETGEFIIDESKLEKLIIVYDRYIISLKEKRRDRIRLIDEEYELECLMAIEQYLRFILESNKADDNLLPKIAQLTGRVDLLTELHRIYSKVDTNFVQINELYDDCIKQFSECLESTDEAIQAVKANKNLSEESKQDLSELLYEQKREIDQLQKGLIEDQEDCAAIRENIQTRAGEIDNSKDVAEYQLKWLKAKDHNIGQQTDKAKSTDLQHDEQYVSRERIFSSEIERQLEISQRAIDLIAESDLSPQISTTILPHEDAWFLSADNSMLAIEKDKIMELEKNQLILQDQLRGNVKVGQQILEANKQLINGITEADVFKFKEQYKTNLQKLYDLRKELQEIRSKLSAVKTVLGTHCSSYHAAPVVNDQIPIDKQKIDEAEESLIEKMQQLELNFPREELTTQPMEDKAAKYYKFRDTLTDFQYKIKSIRGTYEGLLEYRKQLMGLEQTAGMHGNVALLKCEEKLVHLKRELLSIEKGIKEATMIYGGKPIISKNLFGEGPGFPSDIPPKLHAPEVNPGTRPKL